MQFKYDVTIVIPVYNAEKYLRECLESLIHQTYDFLRMELILINDGSKDKSIDICQEYKNKYSNIVLFDNENHGVSYSRNEGIKNAQGKYIMMLDSDDMLTENSIENLIKFFNSHEDEIDLTTYNLTYLRENGKSTPSQKYKMYNKGTAVYDIEEYPFMEQSNVNIMFKNKLQNNRLYDTTMEFSEDQKFNTETLMEKGKIGFCNEACYIYRRESTGLFSTRSNPFYCFEYVLSYNEDIIKEYKQKNKIPKYIQGIILNTISWRICSDEIIPYHYEGAEYKKAIKRMLDILKYIDNEMIIKHPTMNIGHKYYLLNLKGEKIKINTLDNKYEVLAGKSLIGQYNTVGCFVNHFKIKNGIIEFDATINDGIVTNKAKVYLNTISNDGTKKQQIVPITPSNLSYNLSDIKTNDFYNFAVKIDLNEVKEFYFTTMLENNEYLLRYSFSKWVGFNKQLKRYNLVYQNKKIIFRPKQNKFIIIKNTFLKKIKKLIKDSLKYGKKNPKISILRILGHTNKEIWLYQDRVGLHDNGFIQYQNDIKKKDGVKRYYIGDKNEQGIKNLVGFKSLKHKILYLKSSKIITSFVDFPEYCPLSGAFDYYSDMIHYDLIYLQHGILHAKLIRMYSKEYKEISKIVVSSKFEAKNLVENYHYNSEDLIKSGMPRMKNNLKRNKNSKKILFAPSWRKYLIGGIVNNQRKEMKEAFLNSNFYNKINNFLKSPDLIQTLAKEDMTLEFKLHPIFKCYKDLFDINSERISISFDEINIEDYAIFITDFSSFQFDFAQIKTPIIYFLPDEKEFKAGLHSYRELDLKQEDAFGNVCLDEKQLLIEINNIIKNKCEPDKKYLKRMKEFFVIKTNPCESIYDEIKKMD